MSRLGMDTDQIRRLSKVMGTESQAIEAASKRLDSQLASAWWEGKDAGQFKSEWEGHRATLRDIATKLQAASRKLDKNAQEQDSASNA